MLAVFLLVKNQSFLGCLALCRGILVAQFIFEIKRNKGSMIRCPSHLQPTQRTLQKFFQSVADLQAQVFVNRGTDCGVLLGACAYRHGRAPGGLHRRTVLGEALCIAAQKHRTRRRWQRRQKCVNVRRFPVGNRSGRVLCGAVTLLQACRVLAIFEECLQCITTAVRSRTGRIQTLRNEACALHARNHIGGCLIWSRDSCGECFPVGIRNLAQRTVGIINRDQAALHGAIETEQLAVVQQGAVHLRGGHHCTVVAAVK
mmetsp:Transcript_12617/g.22058  ORF Transcript_12617/g.22058 Transcript_12617/m.22058 type:complete len:258 (+) Transcript_12617:1980-2753(+)